MSGYIGIQPVPQATQTRNSFTATSGQTSFATSGYTPNFLDVYLNGLKLVSTAYTATNGSDVVLSSGATTGDSIDVVAFTTFTTADIPSSIADNGNATAITIDSSENVTITQDLYLSGGVYLGGTGSANKLDDYEEGTWTPTFVGGTVGTNSSSGQYTKIGNTVYVNINLNVSNTTSLSDTNVGTLPFTPNQYTTMAVFPLTGFQQLGAMLCAQVATTGVVQLYYVNNASGNNYQQLTNGHLNEGGTVTLRIAGSYTTNS